jgi:hypothetical protein
MENKIREKSHKEEVELKMLGEVSWPTDFYKLKKVRRKQFNSLFSCIIY